jgi:4-hydroxy-tetrahydrodipicolinate reductase
MGKRLIQLLAEDPTLKLGSALERAGHPELGADAGVTAGTRSLGVVVSSSPQIEPVLDAMIDFSLPDATLQIAQWCQQKGIPMVVGTTGFEFAQRQRLEAAASRIALLISPNMSRAVNLLMRLVADAARCLGPTCDIAIVERHHRTKKDAPSGTAKRLAQYATGGLHPDGDERSEYVRPGTQPAHDRISLYSLRIGDSPGEHTVVFALPGETLELTHRALSRDGFVRGALECARFLAGKPPGLYSIEDVLEQSAGS